MLSIRRVSCATWNTEASFLKHRERYGRSSVSPSPTNAHIFRDVSGMMPLCFMRYLEHRGIIPETSRKIWAFVGDGETDEPEALGAQLTLASREKLDNLIFVINCNLQRLDGPVRGNGKIINELEAAFRGARWNVIKVIWGSSWDPLLAR